MSKSSKKSRNVLVDVGLLDAGEHQTKAGIVAAISKSLADRGLTQAQAGSLMGLVQQDVSKLLCGHFEGFSLQRLIEFARILGNDIEIGIRSTRRGEGKISVRVG